MGSTKMSLIVVLFYLLGLFILIFSGIAGVIVGGLLSIFDKNGVFIAIILSLFSMMVGVWLMIFASVINGF